MCVIFFSRSTHAHTLTHPEGREKYALALHEYDSSTSLGMALSRTTAKMRFGFPQKLHNKVKC